MSWFCCCDNQQYYSGSGGSGGSAPLTLVDCFGSGDLSRYWQLQVSGFTDGSCSSCTDLNGTFILDTNNACVDFSFGCCSTTSDYLPATPNVIGSCSDTTQKWKMGVLSGVWYCAPDSETTGGLVFYEIDNADFNPIGDNTFTTASSVSTCGTTPTSVQVNAVPAPGS